MERPPLPGLCILSSGMKKVSSFEAVSNIPMQFGPIILMPALAAISRTSFSRALPASPVSAKPPPTIIAPLIFPSAFFSAFGTAGAGMAKTAISAFSGIASIEGRHSMPRTDEYLGFTG